MSKLALLKDLRQHCRIPYSEPVNLEISWTANGETKSARGKLIEVSVGGLRIEMPEPIPTKTIIRFNVDAFNLSGLAIVCHVNEKDTKFIIGLELTSETREAL